MSSLSDELRSECHGDMKCYCDSGLVADEIKIKEAVKELKEEVNKLIVPSDPIVKFDIEDFIDKIFGDKLSGSSGG